MNVPDDLPMRLVNALQSFNDVEDLLHAVLSLDGQEDPEAEDTPHNTTRAVLRDNVRERFSIALGDLRELIRAIDPALVDLWHSDGTAITPEGERWLRRQLEELR